MWHVIPGQEPRNRQIASSTISRFDKHRAIKSLRMPRSRVKHTRARESNHIHQIYLSAWPISKFECLGVAKRRRTAFVYLKHKHPVWGVFCALPIQLNTLINKSLFKCKWLVPVVSDGTIMCGKCRTHSLNTCHQHQPLNIPPFGGIFISNKM